MEHKFLSVDLLFHGKAPLFPMDHRYYVCGPDGGSGHPEPGDSKATQGLEALPAWVPC